MIGRRTLATLNVVTGGYILLQPFQLSPAACLSAWPGSFGIAGALRECVRGEPLALGFMVASTLGLGALWIGSLGLWRR